jgi:alpha-glucosidase (family GH31 glycosyl hydrolase)
VNFWDRGQVVDGPTEQTVDAPLDELPLYVREGSPVSSIQAPD